MNPILIIILCIYAALFFVCNLTYSIGYLVNADDKNCFAKYSMLPWYLYRRENNKMNLFGCILTSAICLIIMPIWWICQFIYWLCHVHI